MCTAATYQTKGFYFGRTLDNMCPYGEEVAVLPRNCPIPFRAVGGMPRHYAIIGMAHVEDDYPLFYDGMNEKGLCMAGLNFVGNAFYRETLPGMDNIAQFEFIPWVLGQCADVEEVRALLERTNLTAEPFNAHTPPAQLHWLIADRESCIAVEFMADGRHVYDDPAGVLTNNPPFPQQLFQLNNYMGLSSHEPTNRFCGKLPLDQYSRGMGAIGLPGDLSSQSRFVRAAFVRANSRSGEGERESVSQFFHILGSVDQQRGCNIMCDGECEITFYTSCCSAATGIYYYTTYDNSQLTAVDLRRCDLEGGALLRYPLVTEGQLCMEN